MEELAHVAFYLCRIGSWKMADTRDVAVPQSQSSRNVKTLLLL